MVPPPTQHAHAEIRIILHPAQQVLSVLLKNVAPGGWPHGQVVKFACSFSVVQGFAGSDPGRGHGTTHQAVLRWRPTWHKQQDLQLEYTTMYWGALGRTKRGGGKKDWKLMLTQVPIVKKQKCGSDPSSHHTATPSRWSKPLLPLSWPTANDLLAGRTSRLSLLNSL